MGSLSHQHQESGYTKQQHRSAKHSSQDAIKDPNISRKVSQKHATQASIKPTRRPSTPPSTISRNEKINSFMEYTAVNKLKAKERNLKKRNYEKENKYVDQALDIIQFTLQEAIDLEQVIKMSEKLSCDSGYVKEVMTRLLVQLDKIETVNNKKIMQKKKEGRDFIKKKIKQLVQYSEEMKRMMNGGINHQLQLKQVENKLGNAEQIEERRKIRQESSKCLTLTTIKEDLEKEELYGEDYTTAENLNEDLPTEHEMKNCGCSFNTNKLEEYEQIEKQSLIDSSCPLQSNRYVEMKLDFDDNLKNQITETSGSSSVALIPQPTIKMLPATFNRQHISSYSPITPASLLLPFTVDPKQNPSSIQIEKTSLSSCFVLDPNQLHQKADGSSFTLDPCQNNFKFKRVVGPYILVNHDICKSTVTTTTVQDKHAEHVTSLSSSNDRVTVTKETTSIQQNFQLKPEGGDENPDVLLLPGVALELRLLVILLLSLLIEIPLLMIICPLW